MGMFRLWVVEQLQRQRHDNLAARDAEREMNAKSEYVKPSHAEGGLQSTMLVQ